MPEKTPLLQIGLAMFGTFSLIVGKLLRDHFSLKTLRTTVADIREENKAFREMTNKRFEEVNQRFSQVDEQHREEMAAINQTLQKLVESTLLLGNKIDTSNALMQKELEFMKERTNDLKAKNS